MLTPIGTIFSEAPGSSHWHIFFSFPFVLLLISTGTTRSHILHLRIQTLSWEAHRKVLEGDLWTYVLWLALGPSLWASDDHRLGQGKVFSHWVLLPDLGFVQYSVQVYSVQVYIVYSLGDSSLCLALTHTHTHSEHFCWSGRICYKGGRIMTDFPCYEGKTYELLVLDVASIWMPDE